MRSRCSVNPQSIDYDANSNANLGLSDGAVPLRTSLDVRRRSMEAALAVKLGDKPAAPALLPPASPRQPGRAAGAIASAQVRTHRSEKADMCFSTALCHRPSSLCDIRRMLVFYHFCAQIAGNSAGSVYQLFEHMPAQLLTCPHVVRRPRCHGRRRPCCGDAAATWTQHA